MHVLRWDSTLPHSKGFDDSVGALLVATWPDEGRAWRMVLPSRFVGQSGRPVFTYSSGVVNIKDLARGTGTAPFTRHGTPPLFSQRVEPVIGEIKHDPMKPWPPRGAAEEELQLEKLRRAGRMLWVLDLFYPQGAEEVRSGLEGLKWGWPRRHVPEPEPGQLTIPVDEQELEAYLLLGTPHPVAWPRSEFLSWCEELASQVAG